MARDLGIGLSIALVAAAALAAVAAAGAGCGSNGGGFTGDGGSGGDQSGPDGSMLFGDTGTVAGSITIAPQNPVVDVTISNGAVSTMPITFTAMSGATMVSASWSLDRGELGTLGATSGVFTASGNISGKGNVTATYGMATATTTVTVRLHVTENGAPGGADAGAQDGGAGGIGGVGGSPLGGPLPQGVVMALQGMATPPASAQELGWLYPYDKTVWPRGILAPLLQWQTTHNVTGVFIHLSESNFDFQGFYGGMTLVNQPIDSTTWTQATYGNGGDKLHVELTVYDGTTSTAVGPISEDWTIAPGVLKGTVYYTSYNSYLVGNLGAVLAVNPGATAPNVAVAGTGTSCHVCHELSADGQTLFFQDKTYSDGASYDMKNMGAVIASYTGNAPDNTSNDRKFLWSGVYPDGTFAMANANHAREHYTGKSLLFKRSDGTAIATNGWTSLITSAVTPAFSPDGTKLAFNFWDGAGTPTVPAGNGHTLNVMDFACGAADGGVTCGTPPYSLSNLRV